MPDDVPDLAVKASCAACVVVLMPAGALMVLVELAAAAAAAALAAASAALACNSGVEAAAIAVAAAAIAGNLFQESRLNPAAVGDSKADDVSRGDLIQLPVNPTPGPIPVDTL